MGSMAFKPDQLSMKANDGLSYYTGRWKSWGGWWGSLLTSVFKVPLLVFNAVAHFRRKRPVC